MNSTTFGGRWTIDKLEILRRYLKEYTTVLKEKPSKERPFNLIYVDAFAGEGSWCPGKGHYQEYEEFGELRQGSPRIALGIQDRAFDRFLFIEKDQQRSKSLQELRSEFPNRNIEIVNGDANTELPRFCSKLRDFDRAVVFLDPFATEVAWETVEVIAQTEKIDCWILFPIMAINRMMPTGNEPTPALAERLDRVFGSREHWQSLYAPSHQLSLFGDEPSQERHGGSAGIADAYRRRLESVFVRVAPTRRPLVNSKDSPLFELYFAASNRIGAGPAIRIADYILKKW